MANALSKFLKFEPLATLASVNVLGDSTVAGLAYSIGWSGKAVVIITLIWHNAVNVIGSLFARAAVTPNTHVEEAANGRAVTIINDLSALKGGS